MTHEDAFLLAILEDPDNDAPRLIYADWLEERGDPRGEFIRVQCEIVRAGINGDWQHPLRRRESELLTQHSRDWLGTLHALAYRWDFRRGFPEEAALKAEDFLQNLDALFSATPLRIVRLLRSGPFVSDLAACEHLSRLIALHMTDSQIGDGGLQALLASPHITQLTSLRLGNSWLTEESGVALAEAPHLENLEVLGLSMNMLGDRGVIALASAKHLSRLKKLQLGNNQITDLGAQALAESPHLGQLKVLDLSNANNKNPLHVENSIGTKGRDLLLKRFGDKVVLFEPPQAHGH